MLRQKLLVVVGSVIALLMVSGVAAILLLQSVLVDLDHVAEEAIAGTNATATVQLRLVDMQSAWQRHEPESELDRLIRDKLDHFIGQIGEQTHRLGQMEFALGEGADDFEKYAASMDRLAQHIAESVNVPSTTAAFETVNREMQETRTALGDLQNKMHAHTERQQQAATAKFRWTALAFGLAFAFIINALIMISARFSSMILKPVDQLVEAGRCLAREEFGHRVDLNRRDEFGELAQAYNALAAQLQANEQKRVETLHQVARTLSHELNNAISIIQSQLDLVARSSGPDRPQTERLRQIQQALARMSAIVADLTRVRRIVLTDYLSGVKMLDLPKSVEDEPAAAGTT